MGAIFTIAVVIIILVLKDKIKENCQRDTRNSSQNAGTPKTVEQMTEKEKRDMLDIINYKFKTGQISFWEADVLTAHYSGKESATSQFGLKSTMAYSDKVAAEMALKDSEKNANKRIITSAAIGNAIGGLGGQYVATATTLNQISQEQADLRQQLQKADDNYQKVLREETRKKYE